MISINDIISEYNKGKEEENINKYYNIAYEQEKLEKEALNKLSQCPLNTKDIFQHFPNLKTKELSNIYHDKFYNENVTTAIACLSESLVAVSDEWKNYINDYLVNLKKIVENTSVGTALIADLHNPNVGVTNDLFIIKTPMNNEDRILHEAFIGMIGTNALRSLIPNFACIYGYFKCGKVGNYGICSDDFINKEYVIYENINPSQSLRSLLSTMTAEQYMQYFIQILFALKIANEDCSFTHYDLHSGNVLMRNLPQLSLIKYSTNHGDVYIKTDKIATFIDYGMSYIKGNLDNNEFFESGSDGCLLEYSVHNDRSFILHDVFKLLCGSIFACDQLKPYKNILLAYFIGNGNNYYYDDFLSKVSKYYYAAPYNDKTKNFNIDDFINYCLNFMYRNRFNSPIVQPMKGDKIVTCDGKNNVCQSFEDVIDKIGLNIREPIPISTNLNLFVEILHTISNDEERNKYLEDLIFNYPDSKYNAMIGNIDHEIKNYENILNYNDFKNKPIWDRYNTLLNNMIFLTSAINLPDNNINNLIVHIQQKNKTYIKIYG
jgi:hypothetical protein